MSPLSRDLPARSRGINGGATRRWGGEWRGFPGLDPSGIPAESELLNPDTRVGLRCEWVPWNLAIANAVATVKVDKVLFAAGKTA